MLGGAPAARSARVAGTGSAALLLALYVATLAPGVTLWDAGEFIAAVHTLGIPHPPGTPLYVLLGHVWSRVAEVALGVGTARATNLLSALCTAAAGGILGALVTRWTGRTIAGLAAALCAGTASSVWLNATETEVYAASLLLSALMLWAADQRARASLPTGDAGGGRWTMLLAYLFALAPALHLSALVAGPAAIARAAWREDGSLRRGEALILSGALLLAGGAGTGSRVAIGAGAVVLAAAASWPARRSTPAPVRPAALAAVLALLGVSALAVLLVRAQHDPAINQGNPSTIGALLDHVWRRQYEAVPLLPRRAPLWLQIGNVFEYADWQWALGLHGGVQPSWRRTPFTLLYALLGVVGWREHRRVDRATWSAAALLLASASLGVVLYLNLKVGPSYGGGFVPDDAPHEARERDYFFALAFWMWGAWAGLGAYALGARVGRGSLGLLLAALPAALNWNSADRAREPDARLARAVAASLLESTPPRAVLLVNGDNDTYPLWYLQQAEGVRRDVVVVTIPLLGAPWYRGELVRRWALLDPVAQSRWEGEGATLRSIGRHARIESRPLAASVAVPAETRASLSASPWSVRGMVFVEADENEDPRLAWVEDSTVTAAVAAALAPVVRRAPRPSPDGAPRVMFELLRCPSAAVGGRGTGAGSEGASGLLDSACNLR